LEKGDVLSERELDDAVYGLIQHALGLGMIPIAGIMSRRRSDGRHEGVGVWGGIICEKAFRASMVKRGRL